MFSKKHKNKEKTKKNSNESSTDEETIQAFRSWVRKIEQSTCSLSSRLSAIEKRLSIDETQDYNDLLSEDMTNNPIQKMFQLLDKEKNGKPIEQVSQLLDKEFKIMQKEILLQRNEVDSIKQNLIKINTSINSFKETIKKSYGYHSNKIKEIGLKLEQIQQRLPPLMKLGKMKIPVEITGIIGGIIALISAVIIALGQNYIILSPFFLILIGLILIGSAVFKTFRFTSDENKILGKTKTVTAKIEETT